jgi:hypothetical protein
MIAHSEEAQSKILSARKAFRISGIVTVALFLATMAFIVWLGNDAASAERFGRVGQIIAIAFVVGLAVTSGTAIWYFSVKPKQPKPLIVRPLGPQKYCLDCGSVGAAKEYTPGDFWIMVLLLFLAVLPGLIYWAWRLTGRYWGCARCRSKRIIPADAPAAQTALKKVETSTPVPTRAKRFCTGCGTQISPGNKYCAGCGQAVEDVT